MVRTVILEMQCINQSTKSNLHECWHLADNNNRAEKAHQSAIDGRDEKVQISVFFNRKCFVQREVYLDCHHCWFLVNQLLTRFNNVIPEIWLYDFVISFRKPIKFLLWMFK